MQTPVKTATVSGKTVVADPSNTPLPYGGDYIYVTTDSEGKQTYADKNGNAVQPIDVGKALAALGFPSAVVPTGGTGAGNVLVTNHASFDTKGASGIVATSAGGNGGNGGTSFYLVYSEGHRGGDGNIGGSVSVASDGTVTVSGADKYGILAKSQGGTGGNGGGAMAAIVSDPGSGGNGGAGGSVNVSLGNSSAITTTGDGGHGVFAQSLGGDGGHGGDSGSLVALGSDGGNGGAGGNVTVSNSGGIITSGKAAYGLNAQSIGAGAGSGSSAGGLVAIGGNGGGFASGGTVDVSNYGAINTSGESSIGALALSVGGGGGDGGNTGGAFTVGGRAGSGGDGAAVSFVQGSIGSIGTTGDFATAIQAQSIGGGGGNGGRAVSVSVGLAVGVGGAGGPGGKGGWVTVDAKGALSTSGQDANAIVAQSIGGGGGSGGLAVAASGNPWGASASIGIGGSGGTGGDGSTVSVTTNASINTQGDRSSGVVAQSIGGGGGNGGAAIAASMAQGASVNVSVGGSGGSGGSGGVVSVKSQSGSITTLGENSYGIFAQSIGGGGGSGGLAVSGGIGAGTIGVSLGGSGNGGGNGGETTVENAATVSTSGASAYGILVQSVGGGGGAGGLSVAAGLSASATVNVGLGGTGASGGTGGTVEVTNRGAITTHGANAYGILAQSIGGGGGAGGNTISVSGSGGIVAGSVAFALGGKGGKGGSGGDVTFRNTNADVTTSGAGSSALVAQSIGGGGGAAGYAVAASLTVSKDGGAAISVGLGGDGGVGGTAGTVDFQNSGRLSTSGDAASGIVAQSIGGAGGIGGMAIAGALNFSAGSGGAVSVSLGGSGGSGGTGGSVAVVNEGLIATVGNDAFGILAQSIGGQGGNGGLSVGLAVSGTKGAGGAVGVAVGGQGRDGGQAGTVDVGNTANITTSGGRSAGIAAQSIGGDGGAGGIAVNASLSGSMAQTGAVSVALGGDGGAGGKGGNVSITNSGRIATSGGTNTNAAGEAINTDAHAIVAQSLGGSGGLGGIGGSAAIAVGKEQSASASVAVGGSGGAGGTAGTVTVNNSGKLSTGSQNSIGLLAQSIGGGGGAGGGSISLSLDASQSNSLAASASVGGSGGAGAKAGDVSVYNSADITTLGDSAYAILAQSIGGTGGYGGFSVSVAGDYSKEASGSASLSIGGSGGSGGQAGTVNIGSATQSLRGIIATSSDNAAALVAQSIGGGGGSGGMSGSLSAVVNQGASQKTMALNVAVGGTGGSGGTAGAVNVYTASGAQIGTTGNFSYGILAQSIGGKGGNGGGALGADLNIATSGNTSVNASVSVGGEGGDGGVGGAVYVSNAASITTGEFNNSATGLFSYGILAQSIGGNGGAGGFSSAVSFAAGASGQTGANYNASVSVGGWGGDGEKAGTVTVVNSGAITTFGEQAYGIFAQSVGGGGGSGGNTGLNSNIWGEKVMFDHTGTGDLLSAGGSYAGGYGANSNSLSLSIGGFGGEGGTGGSVNVTNSAIIATFGTDGYGIFAQSVGGGGGAGGVSTAASAGFAASNSGTFALSLGGFGGAAGDGGAVTVDNQGTIVTQYAGATGIFAQSVGGGGGNGGSTRGFTLQRQDTSLGKDALKPGKQVNIEVGGFGGAAGDGGTLSVLNSGDIYTYGTAATGIFAQSVGGGGGNGGNASVSGAEISALFDNSKSAEGNFRTWKYSVALGGFGGAAGDGNSVTIANSGQISTTGQYSTAIYAQSVGGGGGNAGNAGTGLSGDFSIGGWGGAGGNGGDIFVSNTGNIWTSGSLATGIYAQSVGGGGGNGGSADFGSIRSVEDELAKSVSKALVTGYGKGSFTGFKDALKTNLKNFVKKQVTPNFGLALGGWGGAAGNGGNIVICNGATYNLATGLCTGSATGATIHTTGDKSNGIFAQSVGGGGGTGGAGYMSNVGKIAFGGAGGSAGDGGNISIVNNGNIIADGNAVYGVFAQSVGGGGGVAGDTYFGLKDLSIDLTKLANGIAGRETNPAHYVGGLINDYKGDGGNISIMTTGTIAVTASDSSTMGTGSIGIFAQSVGGGGGIIGNTTEIKESELGVDLNGDGVVDDTVLDIADGTAAVGTVGGDGHGGAITVTHSGNILSPSWNGYAIFAQSVGGNGDNGNIVINVDGGVIEGGAGPGAAIRVDGGKDNQINVGANSLIYAVGENALIAGAFNETVANSGKIIGNIDLGLGSNALTNKFGGIIETRETINLNGGLFSNAGVADVGGSTMVQTTALTGSYVQTATGSYLGDFNFGPAASDLISASGTATVEGTVTPHLITLANIHTPETFISTAGGASFGSVGMTAVDTLAIDYGVVINNTTDVQLTIDGINFAPQGLTRNQTAAGNYITTILNGQGSVSLGTFFAYLGNLSAAQKSEFAAILQRIHPEAYASQLVPTLYSSQRFGNELQDCPVVAAGTGVIGNEGQCVWARASGGFFDKDSSREFSGVREQFAGASAGAQITFAPSWFFGGGVRYDAVTGKVGDLAKENGERVQGGAVVKYQESSWLLSAAATGGYASFETERFVDLGYVVSYAERAELDNGVGFANLQLRAAKTLEAGQFYARPSLDANAFYLRTIGEHETGAGALNLDIANYGQWIYAFTPSLEIGATFTDRAGTIFRGYVLGGATRYSRDKVGVYASFEGAPSEAGTFRAVTNFDKTVANFGAGIDIFDAGSNLALKLNYESSLGATTETHSGSVRLGWRF
ncbi:hypothetical protein JDN40_03460 [Rhodomicrobium vannielii ATCC 17100]|uniref:autotransporter outer membrane beta-barrel domain-containing protein n=1 Tax=Rhodomicrobium vannielii TaxID=1069 RepID=UPI0019180F9D|nr:autotransporter outer membrane beta-barrel domain-containing protein [Rhodomicrobium vannielii]MBJ7533166.1 hypothetical protein [Rhodomicrobium vannielii ATCC 17100]